MHVVAFTTGLALSAVLAVSLVTRAMGWPFSPHCPAWCGFPTGFAGPTGLSHNPDRIEVYPANPTNSTGFNLCEQRNSICTPTVKKAVASLENPVGDHYY